MTTINHKASNLGFQLVANVDHDLARIYLDNFIYEMGDRLITFGNRQTDFMVILPEGVDKNDCAYNPKKLKRMKKAELREECQKYENCFLCYDHDTRADMIDYLSYRDYEEFYKDVFLNNRFGDRGDYTVRGYNQGDAFEVKIVGKCEEHITEDYLEKLYFSQPNYVRFVVSNEEGDELVELYLDEFKDQYDSFDKDETLRIFSTALESYDFKNEAIKWLEENLPEYLTY